MVDVPSPFGGSKPEFDDYDEFVPAHLPEPGSFLSGHRVLTGEDHVAVHRLTREIFEERSVYDVTFDYNLVRVRVDDSHHHGEGINAELHAIEESFGEFGSVPGSSGRDGGSPGSSGATDGTDRTNGADGSRTSF